MGIGYNMTRLQHMADVVKWLTQRVVVPSCVGSIPIVRPIKSKQLANASFFVYTFLNMFNRCFF